MKFRVVLCAALVLAWGVPAAAAPAYPFQDSALSADARIDDFLSRLSLEEKISLLGGTDAAHLPAFPRLGVRALTMADGPAGLRSLNSDPATAFPVGVAAAATWNPELIRREGAAIGEEALASGVNVMLAPMVNIVRLPNAGRNFETFSEDPVLTAALGTAYVEGMQGVGEGATVKHFVTNEQETARVMGNALVSERALREIYLAAFEPIVKNAKPWAVMTAYNRLNNVFSAESSFLLGTVLRREWGFDGIVMSDWGGSHATIDALRAGLDLEMPGPPIYRGWKLKLALDRGIVAPHYVEDSARRIAKLMLRAGLLDATPEKRGSLNTPRHRAIAEQIAAEGTVLLKNDNNALPLDRTKVKTVAVIGAPADRPVVQGGGSSHVVADRIVSPLDGLRALYGNDVKFLYAQGVDNEPHIPVADTRLLSPTKDRAQMGLHAVTYNDPDFKGGIASEQTDSHFLKFGFGGSAAVPDPAKLPQGIEAIYNTAMRGQLTQTIWDSGVGFSVKWTGFFFAPKDGEYEFSLVSGDSAKLIFNGKTIIDDKSETHPSPLLTFLPQLAEHRAKITLKAGQAYPLEIDFTTTRTSRIAYDRKVFAFGFRVPSGTVDEAVALAQKADAAIVFAGPGSTAESEGRDRHSIGFDPAQSALIEKIAAVNPRTIVVINNGSAVTMPWADKVSAIMDMWLPGQEGGTAIAKLLFGDENPSGRMPITFPKRIEDNPAFLNYAPGRTQFYGEDIFVGYRYYDRTKTEPLFPFGYGLSYTTFSFDNLAVPARVKPGANVSVSVRVKNTGARSGAEVVQLYLRDVAAPVAMPQKALKAFAKVQLAPGEEKTVQFSLAPRDLSYWDVDDHVWVEDPGEFEVMIGASSRDIRASKNFTLLPPPKPQR